MAPDEEVEIDAEQVTPADRDLVRPGASFFWAIGYLSRPTGRRSLTLFIDFRRSPAASPSSSEDALAAGRRYAEEMGWT